MEDNGGELAERVETRCEQLGILPRERGEGVCPLEAGHDQVDLVVPREVEGISAANGCTRSWGGIETPGALEVARIPSVSVPVCVVASVVLVCVVSRCVYTSVLKRVLGRTHSGSKRVCAKAPSCVKETPCVSETPCMSVTPSVVMSVPPCVKETPRKTPCATPSATPCVNETPCASGVVMSVPACVLPGTNVCERGTAGGGDHVQAGGGTCVRTPLCG